MSLSGLNDLVIEVSAPARMPRCKFSGPLVLKMITLVLFNSSDFLTFQHGTELVDQASAKVHELLGSIQQVAVLVGEINCARVEQSLR